MRRRIGGSVRRRKMLQILFFTFLCIKAHSDCSIRAVSYIRRRIWRVPSWWGKKDARCRSNQAGHHFCGMSFNVVRNVNAHLVRCPWRHPLTGTLLPTQADWKTASCSILFGPVRASKRPRSSPVSCCPDVYGLKSRSIEICARPLTLTLLFRQYNHAYVGLIGD